MDLLAAAVAELAAEDVTDPSTVELGGQLKQMLTLVNQMHAQFSRRLLVFERDGLSINDGCRNATAWLQAYGRMSGSTATACVRRARLAAQLPEIEAATLDGAASPEHVDRVVRLERRVGREPVAEAQPALAQAARQVDPVELGRICDRITAHTDPDGTGPDARRDFDRRGLTFSPLDGMLIIRGQLDPEGGAAFRTAMDAYQTPPSLDDPRTADQRRADALVELARDALREGHTPTAGGTRPQVALILPAEALHPQHPTATPTAGTPPPARSATHPPAWLDWIGDIPDCVAQRIACDCDVWRVVLDPTTSQPLDLGRGYRIVPHWLRKALWVRDRGCRFPGCHAPAAWTDAHHVRHWAHHGSTNLRNLLLVCRFHHVLLHEGGWRLHYNPETNTVTVYRPDGRPYELRARPPTMDSAA